MLERRDASYGADQTVDGLAHRPHRGRTNLANDLAVQRTRTVQQRAPPTHWMETRRGQASCMGGSGHTRRRRMDTVLGCHRHQPLCEEARQLHKARQQETKQGISDGGRAQIHAYNDPRRRSEGEAPTTTMARTPAETTREVRGTPPRRPTRPQSPADGARRT